MSGPTFRKPTDEELAFRYQYHAPTGDKAERHEQVRAAVLIAAAVLVRATPCSPEQTRALNALDEAMFLANAAIARERPV